MPKDLEDRAEANSMLDASAKQGIRKPIRLVLVDRLPIVLQGLKSILGTQRDFDVVAAASDGTSCLDAIRNLSPDVALIGDTLPDLTAAEILAIAKAERLSTRLVFFTESDTDHDLTAAIAAGACSAISKYAAPGTMLQSLRLMTKSGVLLKQSDLSPTGKEADGGGKIEKMLELLTPRERQIARLVSEGMSNKEIARRLDVSQGTVKVHLHNIFPKLEITNRTVLATISLLQRTSGFGALALAFVVFAIADELKASEANDMFAHDDGLGHTGGHAGYEVWKKAILQHLIVSKSDGTPPFTERDLLAKASQAANPTATIEALRAAEQFLGSKLWKEGGAVGSGASNLPAHLLPAISDTEIGGGAASEHQISRLASNPMSIHGGYGTFAALAGALIYALSDPHGAAQAHEVDQALVESLLASIGDKATTKLASVNDVDADHAGIAAPHFLSHDFGPHSAVVTPANSVTQEGIQGQAGADGAGHNLQTPVGVQASGHVSSASEHSLSQLMGGTFGNLVDRSPIDSKSAPSDSVLDVASGPGRLNLAAFGALAWLHLTAATKSIPPHTLAWIYDPASNQTIVYVNPTDHIIDVGDRGLVEIHLQGIVAIADAEVVTPPADAAVVVTLEQLEQALISATTTEETVLSTNSGHASESSLTEAGVWSARADDGLSFQFAHVRTGSGTSAKSSAFARDPADTTEESAEASGVSTQGLSIVSGHGSTPPGVESPTSKSEPMNPNAGALSTTQNEIAPSGETADSTVRGNSDHGSNPGQAKGAAAEIAEGESKHGNGVGKGNEHHSQAADSSPAAEPGDVEHGNSDHSAPAKGAKAGEGVATGGNTDHGNSPHAAEPGSAKAAATEMAEAKSKPGNSAAHDNGHHAQAPTGPPGAAEPGSAEHGNSGHSVSAKEAEAGESVATAGNPDHGNSQHASAPGTAKAVTTEMAEAKSKPDSGVGHDNEHQSHASDPASPAWKTAEPVKMGTATGGADRELVFRFDSDAAPSKLAAAEPKEPNGPLNPHVLEAGLDVVVKDLSGTLHEPAAHHGNNDPHHSIVHAAHDLLI
jgi:DNA-binding NarL/FixJ family response regulator